ncbi:MAG: carbohydrate ABC transporter permease [Ornithinimicrobium sp.]|uniref:carbohydrate ABC transporter permease n=1 Tax=Ornithinimicrobium sp. TaxID=1977084 RepID=UPI0026DFD6A9|nr:carbohydrate ABC transporter permease [Ornithinimicrobium sp.]MDO5738787.1 carbohydrate ABC transporter permease [Ornithinimicrobium sp.]
MSVVATRTAGSRLNLGLVLGKILVYVLLTALALAVLYPLAWMVLSGFKSNSDIFANPWGLPTQWHPEHFGEALRAGVGRYFLNSIFVTALSIVTTTLISAWAAYGLTRTNLPFDRFGTTLILGGLMVAPTVALVPLFGLLQRLNLFDTLWGLVVLYTAYRIPFTTFLMRAYFIDIPPQVDEAARVDGANHWQIFWRLILPMSRPILVSAALLQALFAWNEFAFALVFLSDGDLKTLPVGLMDMQSRLLTNWPVQFAGLTLAALPMIGLFLFGQRQFFRGLSDGMGK